MIRGEIIWVARRNASWHELWIYNKYISRKYRLAIFHSNLTIYIFFNDLHPTCFYIFATRFNYIFINAFYICLLYFYMYCKCVFYIWILWLFIVFAYILYMCFICVLFVTNKYCKKKTTSRIELKRQYRLWISWCMPRLANAVRQYIWITRILHRHNSLHS